MNSYSQYLKKAGYPATPCPGKVFKYHSLLNGMAQTHDSMSDAQSRSSIIEKVEDPASVTARAEWNNKAYAARNQAEAAFWSDLQAELRVDAEQFTVLQNHATSLVNFYGANADSLDPDRSHEHDLTASLMRDANILCSRMAAALIPSQRPTDDRPKPKRKTPARTKSGPGLVERSASGLL